MHLEYPRPQNRATHQGKQPAYGYSWNASDRTEYVLEIRIGTSLADIPDFEDPHEPPTLDDINPDSPTETEQPPSDPTDDDGTPLSGLTQLIMDSLENGPDDLGDMLTHIEESMDAGTVEGEKEENLIAILADLRNGYQQRFNKNHDTSDIKSVIECLTRMVRLTPDQHPNKPWFLNDLGIAYQHLFQCQGDTEDINNAIESHSQAMLFTSEEDLNRSARLSNLGTAHTRRFEHQGDLDDINTSIKYHFEVMINTLDNDPRKPSMLNALVIAHARRFEHEGDINDLNTAIEFQLKAVQLTPEEDPSIYSTLNNLGNIYHRRFEHKGDFADINLAIECRSKAVSLTTDAHAEKALWLNNLGAAYQRRFEHQGDVTDIETAIECQSQAVLLTPTGHPDRAPWLNNLGTAYQLRYRSLGEKTDSDRAIGCQSEAVSLMPDSHPGKSSWLSNLGSALESRYQSQGNSDDIDSAIKYKSQALLLTPDGHAEKPSRFNNLGLAYQFRFDQQGNVSDLNMAIEYLSQALAHTPDGHPDKVLYSKNLGTAYMSLFMFTMSEEHIESGGKYLREAAQSTTGSPRIVFQSSLEFAKLADTHELPDAMAAYQRVINLIPQLVWVGSTVSHRYEIIEQMGNIVAEAASYAIAHGNYESALEWLEQGRSIVWNQILQLRSPVDDLSHSHPSLAEELKLVGEALEQAGSRPSTHVPLGDAQRSLEIEAQDHYALATRWENLLQQVRRCIGFENFMSPPKANSLKQAAIMGSVVVINFCDYGCDALVIRPRIDVIEHIPLSDFSLSKAIDIQNRLVPLTGRQASPNRGARRPLRLLRQIEWKQPLRDLWLYIVEPVLRFLGHTSQSGEELPHITWCTIGPLSFLPLHAAGPYDGANPNTFDLVVSSYTPTLGALLGSNPNMAAPSTGILAVGQKNTPGQATLPQTEIELALIRGHANRVRYTQLDGEQATANAILDAMEEHSWLHLACHGSQNPDDPSRSAFHLYDSDLTLAQITKRAFKDKGLAFLSACQTAAGDSKVPDEALHLAAGVLMAGYPSVIATMWSIEDEDGPEVAGRVYEELLKGGQMDHTRAARALHKAVGHLREKVGMEQLERWAPFIHMGL